MIPPGYGMLAFRCITTPSLRPANDTPGLAHLVGEWAWIYVFIFCFRENLLRCKQKTIDISAFLSIMVNTPANESSDSLFAWGHRKTHLRAVVEAFQ
jgi:hypothetical protein